MDEGENKKMTLPFSHTEIVRDTALEKGNQKNYIYIPQVAVHPQTKVQKARCMKSSEGFPHEKTRKKEKNHPRKIEIPDVDVLHEVR